MKWEEDEKKSGVEMQKGNQNISYYRNIVFMPPKRHFSFDIEEKLIYFTYKQDVMYSIENKSEESRAIQNNAGKHVSTAQFKDNRSQNKKEKGMTTQLEKKENLTGMPDDLKEGIESLSGFSMDDVRVHYNSSKPATVQALAYTQGTDIHVAPGQEKCLPHEAWHVAQQMAGRVSPTTNINGMLVNDNVELEREADEMGAKAVQLKIVNCDNKIKRDINNSQKIVQNFEMECLENKHCVVTTVESLYLLIKRYKEALNNWSKTKGKRAPDFPKYKGVPLTNKDIDDVILKCYDDNVKGALIEKDSGSDKTTKKDPDNKEDLIGIIQKLYNDSFKSGEFEKLHSCIIDSNGELTALSHSAMSECGCKKDSDFKGFVIDKLCSNEFEFIKKYAGLNLINHDDLIHQLAQDYLLYSKDKGLYADLIGIHNQYSDFFHDSTTKKAHSISGLRVYRSMSMKDFLTHKLEHHGGSLAEALNYDNDNPKPGMTNCGRVIVEFVLNGPVSLLEIGEGDEGTSTTNESLGRKSEKRTLLPVKGCVYIGGAKKAYKAEIFSVMLQNGGSVFGSRTTMRVVYANCRERDGSDDSDMFYRDFSTPFDFREWKTKAESFVNAWFSDESKASLYKE